MRLTGKLKALLVCFLATGAVAFAQTAPQPQQQQKVEVSDDELGKIADAFEGITEINVKAQQEMVKVVEDSGFEVDRFNELYEASQDPAKEGDASDEEKEKFGVAMNKMQELQSGFQKEMEDVIKEEGITLDRYQQVAMALQSDVELQQRLQSLLEKKQQQ
ncbi:DUF4168 domain-containing protein [Sinomicrobium soli]|uniref:DUF4168 domain-containing protein n=1 Tax=Sinomicrobium sp. N-1-3-6 TaxID=2219864 RepID=UPI000DCD20A9|nr:DUF4168 domain-containing protein [Sinomicrobium sp. N-1-3-6]RAV29493.1 hypothetical protein DN748_08315 [Sinomicrobium sp. N-1-3-6]